jgi:hypothetical protein
MKAENGFLVPDERDVDEFRDRLAIALGRCVLGSGRLELALIEAFSILSRKDISETIEHCNQKANSIGKVIKWATNVLPKSGLSVVQIEKFSLLFERAKESLRERNDYVHSDMSVAVLGSHLRVYHAKPDKWGTTAMSGAVVDISEIEDTARSLLELPKEFKQLYEECGLEPVGTISVGDIKVDWRAFPG